MSKKNRTREGVHNEGGEVGRASSGRACGPCNNLKGNKYSKSPTYEPSSCELSKMLMCMLAPVCQLLYCTTVLFKVLYCKIKNVFFIFVFVCFLCMYYWCEKYYKPIIVQYYIANYVSWVPRLTLVDL